MELYSSLIKNHVRNKAKNVLYRTKRSKYILQNFKLQITFLIKDTEGRGEKGGREG